MGLLPSIKHTLSEPTVVTGGCDGWNLLALVSLLEHNQRCTLVVVENDDAAVAMQAAIASLTRTPIVVELLLEKAALAFARATPDRGAGVERMRALLALALPPRVPTLVIASVAALLRKSIPLANLRDCCVELTTGGTVDREQLLAKLIGIGMQRTPAVDDAGSFAVRGGVIDIFSPASAQPVRLELFGDTIESLRTFDPLSQRTLAVIDRLVIAPSTELFSTAGNDIRTRLRDLAEQLTFPTKKVRELIESLLSGDQLIVRDPYLPAYHAELHPVLTDNIDFTVVVIHPAACARAAHFAYEQTAQLYAQNNAAHLCYPLGDQVSAPSELSKQLAAAQLVADPIDFDQASQAKRQPLKIDLLLDFRQQVTTARNQNEQEVVAVLANKLTSWLQTGVAVTIVCNAQQRLDRLHGVLQGRGFAVAAVNSLASEPPAQTVGLMLGLLSESFVSTTDARACLSSFDIFGDQPSQTVRRRTSKREYFTAIHDFSNLSKGDYVVHDRHGVARYLGLSLVPIGGVAGLTATSVETLELQYDGAKLYLPVYRLGELERYVGAQGNQPRLDKLGGVTWLQTKSKVSRSLQVLAEELLVLYAQRAALTGHSFGSPGEGYQEFAESFPYQETPDQADAIDAVLSDMARNQPMDRLVCGDVGYGKTEVALRAIFRCVEGGKQAVLLAPTTVLVEQHAKTFAHRFANTAISMHKLSRFVGKADQAKTIRALAEGKVDVVIGTHRLLSNEVRVANLGLVVIDEEQRFGVAHKERLKKLRANVDVLTLTATPIPRTLHLALAGMRDLSIIATPPRDRKAVRTTVSKIDDQVIKLAIEQELARGGQVFFITRNILPMRVSSSSDEELQLDANVVSMKAASKDHKIHRSIEQWAKHIQTLVPAAKVGIAHGQLSADDLETAMVDFVDNKTNVLLATTLVESGLDIPNANTMLVAHADRFGLAQLYQLRGRVGRSSTRAYCYLLVDNDGVSEVAQRRLDALIRFADLGSGFAIASQDLEIRGGGELLGAKQSGSIAAVGFDTYVRMLEQAIGELRGQPVVRETDPELSAEIPGFLPDSYIPDVGIRLDVYKRLASAVNTDELQQISEELVDRFGPLPYDATLLYDLMALKCIARPLRAASIEVTRTKLAIGLREQSKWPAAAKSHGWKQAPDGRWVAALAKSGGVSEAKGILLSLVAHATDGR